MVNVITNTTRVNNNNNDHPPKPTLPFPPQNHSPPTKTYSPTNQPLPSQVGTSFDNFNIFYTGVFDDVDSFGVAFDDDLPWASMSPNLFITPAPNFPPPLGSPPYIPGAAWIYEEMKDKFGEWWRLS